MAVVTNTYQSFTSARNREEFADAIYMITPEETPFISMIGRESVESLHPEWSTDTLATPSTSNAAVQGDEFSFAAVGVTTRVGNYTQISTKSYRISRSQEKTLKAGPKSELGRQRRKKGVELRKDMESILLSNQASSAGNSSTAAKLGGLPTWLTTNVSRGGSGASGGFSSGVTTVATNGTQRAFARAQLDAVLLSTYNNGGTPTTFMVSPYLKQQFSQLLTDSTVVPNRTAVSGKDQATIYAAADMYRSDFGTIDIVPNRVMGAAGATIARNAFLIDPEFLALGVFDDVQEIKTAKTGDAEGRVLITEYTLKVKNEAGLGVVADLFGLTASS